MKSTVTLSPEEVAVAIGQYLRTIGYQVEGKATYNVVQPHFDGLQSFAGGLTSAQAIVVPIQDTSYHTSSLASQIAAVESQGQNEGR